MKEKKRELILKSITCYIKDDNVVRMCKLDRSNEPAMWNEVFFALFPSILKAQEAMANDGYLKETVWNWDTDSKSKAND